MKKYIYIFLLLCLSSVLYSQGTAMRNFGGRLIVGPVNMNGSHYNILGSFTDDFAYYTSDSCQVGDVIWQNFGENCFEFRIDTINSKTGGVLNVDVFPLNGGIPQSQTSAVFRKTPNRDFTLWINNLPPTLETCMTRHFNMQVDTIQTGATAITLEQNIVGDSMTTIVNGDTAFVYLPIGRDYYGQSSQCTYRADDPGGVVYSDDNNGNATITVSEGVQLKAFTIIGDTEDLDGSNNYKVRINFTSSAYYSLNTGDNTTSASSDLFAPMVQLVNRTNIDFGGPSVGAPYTVNEATTPPIQISYIGTNDMEIRVTSLNAFNKWAMTVRL